MSDQASPELHIASFIVHCRPPAIESVVSHVSRLDKLEIGTSSPEGKLVVLAEGTHQQDLLEAMEAIESLEGVLECILVYHEVLSTAEASHQLIA